jgi:undecaprenyl-diphosphatase
MAVSLAVVLSLGLWGVFFPDIRASQGAINEFLRANGSEVADSLARIIDRIFSPLFAVILTLILAIATGITRRSFIPAAGIALAVLVAWLPVEIVKIAFHQRRPPLTQLLDSLVSVSPTSSFPSGHVGFAMALSFALILLVRPGRLKILVVSLLSALVVVVAVTRLYAGMHYLTDTVGAVAASAFGIIIFCQMWPVFVIRVSPNVRC